MRKTWKMLFRIGMTVIIVSGIAVYYMNNSLQEDDAEKLSALAKPDIQFENNVKDIDRKDEHLVMEGQINDGIADPTVDEEKEQQNKNNKKDEHAAEQEQANKNWNPRENVARKPVKSETKLPEGKPGLKPVIHKALRKMSGTVTPIHLCVVACGDRAPETLVLLKSAALFSSSPLVLHIFAEEALHQNLHDQLEFWPAEYKDRLEYNIYSITLPTGESGGQDEWMKLFKPCAAQRLFLPELLTDVDSLIYVDTDVLFISPLEGLWSFFSRFNATQLVALAPEHEDMSASWYGRFARHPFYGPYGVNSGVMLMNLTRLRQTTWLSDIKQYYVEYRLKIPWGDQDLINIYFHYKPEQLYLLTCEWNYRPDHCMYMSNCHSAEKTGAMVLHGSRRVMHNEKQPAFRAVYNAFRDHRFGDNLQYHLVEKLRKNLQAERTGNCATVPHIFTKQVEQFALQREEQSRKV